MFKVDVKRAKIVEEHFYPWRKLFAVVILFTALSFVPLVTGWLQGVFQVAGLAGMFLVGGRWMFDRTVVAIDLPVEIEADFEIQYREHLKGLDGNGRRVIREILERLNDPNDGSASHLYE